MLKDLKWDVPAPAKTQEPWRELLNTAADLIDKRGHAKGVMEDTVGGLCIQGALSVAAFGTAHPFSGEYLTLRAAPLNEATEKLYRYRVQTGRMCGWDNKHSCEWNNQPERTKDEVVSVLRACAAA